MIIYNLCPKITILGEAAGRDPLDQFLHETPVKRVLDDIAGMRVGKVLFDEINLTPHQITIIPARDTEKRNAFTSPVHPPNGSAIDAVAARSAKGSTVMTPDTSKLGVCRDEPLQNHGHAVIGTGRGTEEIVNFTPRMWSGEGDKTAPDVVLVHELTHSLRAKMGTFRKVSTCNAFENDEEFFAILVENLFRSECIKAGRNLILRWHHKGTTEMPPKLANPAFFFQFHKKRVQQMEKEMPSFTKKLKAIDDIAFNPFVAKHQVG